MTALSPLAAGAAVGPRRVAARLSFRKAGGRTRLTAQHTPHPFHITLPFHLAGDPDGMATLYLQSSAGGLYGDDDLTLDIDTGVAAAAHVTTQAASIVHAARGGQTRQSVTLHADADSLLEYLPDPVILFPGADLDARVAAHLAPGARLLLCDSALTHDPEGQGGSFGRYANAIDIVGPDGVALARERTIVTGNEWVRRTGRLPVHGVMIAAGAIDAAAVRDAIDAALPDPGGAVYGAACAFPERGLVVTRLLAASGADFTAALDGAWRAARMVITGRPPPPRNK